MATSKPNEVKKSTITIFYNLRTCAMLRGCAVLLSLALAIQAKMKGFVVKGRPAAITQYPYAMYLSVACVNKNKEEKNWMCGSSVVNQNILLTAGHCVYPCISKTKMLVNREEEGRDDGVIRASEFVAHKKYDPRTLVFDIALIKLNHAMKLNSKLSRVALMKKPPYHETAYIAGWGRTDELNKQHSKVLKHVDQTVWEKNDCEEKLGHLPVGTICARSKNEGAYPSRGDSGSALVVRGYIQIGILSFRVSDMSFNTVVYTDVGYYYDWIVKMPDGFTVIHLPNI